MDYKTSPIPQAHYGSAEVGTVPARTGLSLFFSRCWGPSSDMGGQGQSMIQTRGKKKKKKEAGSQLDQDRQFPGRTMKSSRLWDKPLVLRKADLVPLIWTDKLPPGLHCSIGRTCQHLVAYLPTWGFGEMQNGRCRGANALPLLMAQRDFEAWQLNLSAKHPGWEVENGEEWLFRDHKVSVSTLVSRGQSRWHHLVCLALDWFLNLIKAKVCSRAQEKQPKCLPQDEGHSTCVGQQTHNGKERARVIMSVSVCFSQSFD